MQAGTTELPQNSSNTSGSTYLVVQSLGVLSLWHILPVWANSQIWCVPSSRSDERGTHLPSGNVLHSVSHLFIPWWMRPIQKWRRSICFSTLSSWPCDSSAMPSWENGQFREHTLDWKSCRLIRKNSSPCTNSLCGSKFVQKKVFKG